MKKIIALLLIAILALSLLAGCDRTVTPEGETQDDLTELDKYALQIYGMTRAEMAKGLRVGVVLRGMSESEEKAAWREGLLEELELELDEDELQISAVPSINEALLLLSSGKVDIVETPLACAKYIAARNDSIGFLDDPLYGCDICMVFGKEDTQRQQLANRVIAEMKEDGTLAAIQARYIDSAEELSDPISTPIPATEYETTLRVGISGCTPPYDFTTAAGEPAGYNIDFLAEFGKRAHVNIELVPTLGTSFQLDLAADKIDAFFCYFTESFYEDGVYTPDVFEESETLTDLFLFTDSYAQDTLTVLVSSNRAERGMAAREEYDVDHSYSLNK